ncbi:641_t:CDS:1, partial [Racocetra fulgida]
AAVGTVFITSFFLKVKKNNLVSDEENNQDQDNQNMDDDNTEIYQQSFENIIENVDYNDGENQKQSIEDTIKRIDQYIKNEKLSKTELTWYQSVVWYLCLLQNGKKKIESSETVAAICNKDKYLAQCIRR